MQQAVDSLWRFTAELFDADEVELALIDDGVAVDPRDLRDPWEREVFAGSAEATSACPKRWRIARAVRRGYIPNTSGRCWQRCSISSAFTPASSGKEDAMQRLVDIAPAQIPQIWALLSQIPDPEVPVLTITDRAWCAA